MDESEFRTVFKQLTGNLPLRWQERLFREHFAKGELPQVIDLPTGLGKTMVMAIWLIARTVSHCLPRRLVYVVDRRAIVDQATELAIKLQSHVEQLADFKRTLGLDSRALPVSTLRGQHVDNQEWLADPASPAIIVGTVDMVGSRLLFEGYGTSRKMRPYHAGLLGADTLVVLDEAHLVPPFERLLETISNGDREFGPRESQREVVPRFQLMSLSATGRAGVPNTFHLIDADLDDVVKQRLNARKRLTIKDLAHGEKPPIRVATEAWKMSNAGADAVRVIVFCNSRTDAEASRNEVEKLIVGGMKKGLLVDRPETELFVGGRRVWERQAAADWLRSRGFLAGTKEKPTHAVFVFATSAGEVGVDLDADHMVCDLVAWERMVQRLGRVNRRGDGDARIVVVATNPAKPDAALKKEAGKRSKAEMKAISDYENSRAWRDALRQLPSHRGVLDASPGAIQHLKSRAVADTVLQERIEQDYRDSSLLPLIRIACAYVPPLPAILASASTPAPLRPALTRALVDAWSMTSLREHTGRPVVEPWLRGWVDDEPQTAVVWRKHLPLRPTDHQDGRSVVKLTDVAAFFEAAPPHASELLEIETYHVLDWLERRANSLLKLAAKATKSGPQDEPAVRRQDVVAVLLDAAGDVSQTLRLRDLAFDSADKKENERNWEEVKRQLMGATVVLDARLAGLGQTGLLNAECEDIPRTIDDGEAWLHAVDGVEVVRFRVRLVDSESPSSPDWHSRFRLPTVESEDGEPTNWLAVEKWRHDAATEDDRSEGRLQSLAVHQQWAADRAKSLAERLGLTAIHPQYAEMLAIAARLHDEGKRSQRWQRAFKAPNGEHYAKTPGPVNLALLDGYRHEFGSLLFAARDADLLKLSVELQELALHIIAAHHGFARPLIGIGGCDDAPPSALEGRARDVALRFARLQKQWGPWGLAWWESLLRAVDQEASRDNDATGSQTTEEP
ncbi:MAG: type I-U CRISPR-associated helicase/endonuclease Cas3 [Pirellulaceae bacterium]|nr:type I-U CRISPR-associated helicase/endonuclease Cas3 [Pirellulaceae bacterium]